MCVFMNSLPPKSKTKGTNKKPSMVLSIRPCNDTSTEKVWYRFRLLAFTSPNSNDRDYPFIERFVHTKWGKNDKGFPVIEDEVVCPVTKWVDWEGDRYNGCPICRIANQYFVAFKESNWKDRDAARKNNEIGRKYQAIVPVYVVKDPNYAANNNKFKVIIFNDKKQFQEFEDKVKKASRQACVFNGKQAVDCCIHMIDEPVKMHEGEPNEYVYHKKTIDKITFSNKPYDIPSINKETIDAFPFDDTYYVSSTKEELVDFYNKYIKVSNDDIADEDDSVTVMEVKNSSVAEPAAPKLDVGNDLVEESSDDAESIDDLTVDSDDLPAVTASPSSTSADISDDEMKKMIDDLDI